MAYLCRHILHTTHWYQIFFKAGIHRFENLRSTWTPRQQALYVIKKYYKYKSLLITYFIASLVHRPPSLKIQLKAHRHFRNGHNFAKDSLKLLNNYPNAYRTSRMSFKFTIQRSNYGPCIFLILHFFLIGFLRKGV